MNQPWVYMCSPSRSPRPPPSPPDPSRSFFRIKNPDYLRVKEFVKRHCSYWAGTWDKFTSLWGLSNFRVAEKYFIRMWVVGKSHEEKNSGAFWSQIKNLELRYTTVSVFKEPYSATTVNWKIQSQPESRELFYLVGMLKTQPRRQHLSSSEKSAPRRQEG